MHSSFKFKQYIQIRLKTSPLPNPSLSFPLDLIPTYSHPYLRDVNVWSVSFQIFFHAFIKSTHRNLQWCHMLYISQCNLLWLHINLAYSFMYCIVSHYITILQIIWLFTFWWTFRLFLLFLPSCSSCNEKSYACILRGKKKIFLNIDTLI